MGGGVRWTIRGDQHFQVLSDVTVGLSPGCWRECSVGRSAVWGQSSGPLPREQGRELALGGGLLSVEGAGACTGTESELRLVEGSRAYLWGRLLQAQWWVWGGTGRLFQQPAHSR